MPFSLVFPKLVDHWGLPALHCNDLHAFPLWAPTITIQPPPSATSLCLPVYFSCCIQNRHFRRPVRSCHLPQCPCPWRMVTDTLPSQPGLPFWSHTTNLTHSLLPPWTLFWELLSNLSTFPTFTISTPPTPTSHPGSSCLTILLILQVMLARHVVWLESVFAKWADAWRVPCKVLPISQVPSEGGHSQLSSNSSNS
jgi:hypothetical protein